MTKLEELKAAYEATTPGERYSTGVVVCVPAEGGMDYLLRGCHADGVKNDPEVEFAVLAHNLMPTLLEAVELLKELRSVGGCEHRVDKLLEKLQ